MKRSLFATVLLAAAGLVAAGAEPAPQRCTYLMTGLHCPPCTATVERALKKTPGVKSVKIDWNTKNASIEFDESTLPAHKVAAVIAATPHMMGGRMHYEGWLTIHVAEIKDQASGDKVRAELAKLKGVAQSALYINQNAVAIRFAPGDATTTAKDLLTALNGAGFTARNYP